MSDSTKINCNTCGNKPHIQDEWYGKGIRVHNMQIKKDGSKHLVCTRCGNKIIKSNLSK